MSRLASPTVTHVGLEHAWLSWPAPPNATSAFAEYAVHAIDVATNAPLLSVGGAVGRQFARVDGLQPGRSYRFSVQQSAGGRVVGEPSALSPPATTAAAADVVLHVGGRRMGLSAACGCGEGGRVVPAGVQCECFPRFRQEASSPR